MVAPVRLADRLVGPGQPCLVVAEAGVNHNGDLALARRLVDAAAQAGADAVKFQTFRAERLVTADAPKAPYQMERTERGESQQQMLRRLELSPAAHRELLERCRARRILFLSTPFDEESVALLTGLGVCALKIASGELTNLPLLACAARTGLPLIVSTGMATLEDVRAAVATVRSDGNTALVLLHCVSAYPAQPSDANLRAMDALSEAFGVAVGYSDHTLGAEVALAAVARGACVIEKHLTLDRALPGPDHAASVEPQELAALVRAVRTVEASLGQGRKEPVPAEAGTAAAARRSLVAARRIPAGSRLSTEAVAILRPGTGLAPARLPDIIGRTAARDIPPGTILTEEMLR